MKKLFILFMIAFLSFTSVTILEVEASNNDTETEIIEMIEYDIKTKKEKKIKFTVKDKVSSTPAHNPNIQPRIVIGTDNMEQITNTTATPYVRIAHIYMEYTSPNNEKIAAKGTAFLIDSDTFLTAGHALYSRKKDSQGDMYGWATSVRIKLALDESYQPYPTKYASAIESSDGWVNHGNTSHDYGIITVSSGYSVGYFGLSSSVSQGSTVTVTGYPKDIGNGDEMWSDSGSVSTVSTYYLRYNADTLGGQSGSPVYNTSHQAVAIHTNGVLFSNQGRRLTSSLITYLVNTHI